jgi:L-ribulose-5-phosphate 3-epimerase
MKAYTLGLYEKSMPNELDIREKLLSAKKAGYDFLEISIDETEEKLSRLDWSSEEKLDILHAVYETGIPIRTMCLSGHRKYPLGSRDEAIRNRGLEIIEKAIDLADDLGIRIIMLAGYDVYYEESGSDTRQMFEKNLLRAVELAARKSILMGFETMETEFMNTVEKAMKYVELAASDYLAVYPDIGNITNAAKVYGKDVLEDLKKGKGHVLAMHLKETAPGKFREIPYGLGHVNFEEAIETAWKLGIRRYVAEFWYVGNDNWEEELSKVSKLLTAILDQQDKENEDEHRKKSLAKYF